LKTFNTNILFSAQPGFTHLKTKKRDETEIFVKPGDFHNPQKDDGLFWSDWWPPARRASRSERPKIPHGYVAEKISPKASASSLTPSWRGLRPGREGLRPGGNWKKPIVFRSRGVM